MHRVFIEAKFGSTYSRLRLLCIKQTHMELDKPAGYAWYYARIVCPSFVNSPLVRCAHYKKRTNVLTLEIIVYG